MQKVKKKQKKKITSDREFIYNQERVWDQLREIRMVPITLCQKRECVEQITKKKCTPGAKPAIYKI